MAIEVRIPTILRTYTGGEKAVTADGASLSALIDDLEANHPGIKERLVEDSDSGRTCAASSTSTSTTRTSGSSAGSRPRSADGDQVVVLPAVAGG